MKNDWSFPDNKIHGANMRLIWGRQDPGGPHVDPMNLAIWVPGLVPSHCFKMIKKKCKYIFMFLRNIQHDKS